MDQNTEHIWSLMGRKLSGEASTEELAELEHLLTKDPSQIYLMEVMQDIWNHKTSNDLHYSENKYKELMLRMQQSGVDMNEFTGEKDFISNEADFHKLKSKRHLYIGGGILILSISIFCILFFNTGSEIPTRPILTNSEISTKYGLKTNMLLPDGTKVYLNSGSKLTYDKNYGTNNREVSLTGEAFFDVIKNPQKPFIIHTNRVNIRVLGTAFNVRCYPDEKTTETSLIRGSLEVSTNGGSEKIILKPSEKLIVSNIDQKKQMGTIVADKTIGNSKNIIELSHVSLLSSDSSVIETSWVSNRLVFRSESFEAVAHKMEKWYGIEIVFSNEKLKNKKLTGIFDNETVLQALDALQLTTKFSYKFNNGHIVLSN